MSEGILGFDEAQSYVYLDGLVLTSQIFWGPDADLCREIITPDFARELNRLVSILGSDAIAAAQDMIAYLQGFSDSGRLFEELEEAYVRLFVSDRGGLRAPLYHSFYDSVEGLLMGRPYQLMRQKLQTAGLSLAGQSSEPPDHLSVEFEYLFVLLDAALSHKNSEFETEARAFATEEMLPWLTRFHEKLCTETAPIFYAGAAGLMLSLVRRAAARGREGSAHGV